MRTLVSKARISPTREDYIRAIYLLQERGKEPGIIEIAKRLNLSKSTVSERIKELTQDGLTISKPYSTISLTKEGAALGKKMTYKHRLIEVFLHRTLKLPAEKIHQEAERLEHAFSDEAIKQLASFLKHPTHDPHGSPLSPQKHVPK
jgi:DtxR family transcriptional regulator, Mn-dependent transcriptional regulator